MKRLLVTGGSGFTGRHFLAFAERAGFNTFSLQADLTVFQAVYDEVMRINPTHIVHLGAISAVTHDDQQSFYRVNLFGSLNLINALNRLPKKPEKVLFASSANVYGNINSRLISESDCPKPVNHYAMSKLAMEHMALSVSNNLPLFFTRPFNYTGVGHDYRFVIPKIVQHIKNNAKTIELGNLDVYREYNDVRMVCEAYIKLLGKGISGEIYNICTGRVLSLNDVMRVVEQLVGYQMDVKVNPSFVRANEVKVLAGNPEKLKNSVGALTPFEFKETLCWMLENKGF